MANMGFEFTHFAEFAWAMLEPAEGQYNFEWLDKTIELAAKQGLKVILCTHQRPHRRCAYAKNPEVLVTKKMANAPCTVRRPIIHGRAANTGYWPPT